MISLVFFGLLGQESRETGNPDGVYTKLRVVLSVWPNGLKARGLIPHKQAVAVVVTGPNDWIGHFVWSNLVTGPNDWIEMLCSFFFVL